MRISGQDVQVLAVQNIDLNGQQIGSGYNLIANFETVKLDLSREKTSAMATKDTAESYRGTHTMGTVALTGLKTINTNSEYTGAYGTSAQGVVQFQDSANGDQYVVPVFMGKLQIDVSGKGMTKFTVDLEVNGVVTVNGSPILP